MRLFEGGGGYFKTNKSKTENQNLWNVIHIFRSLNV